MKADCTQILLYAKCRSVLIFQYWNNPEGFYVAERERKLAAGQNEIH